MLEAISVGDVETLIGVIPKALRTFSISMGEGLSEPQLRRKILEVSRLNAQAVDAACYLGAGIYDHHVPAAVDAIAMRSEFLTAYTPYQGEASQGTLQSIYEYQSLMCRLTGMDFSNASMYDGASALAEAVLLALKATGRRKVVIPQTVHPEYRQVVKTYLSFYDAQVIEPPYRDGSTDEESCRNSVDADTAAVVVQQPNFFGALEKTGLFSSMAKAQGAFFIACVNPITLGILEPPGAYGADIAVGEGQPLGNPMAFGGPHFGFFTVREPHLRKMPGRIAGRTVDADGKTAFVLTLQAREQHIRREKATSNICTNQALCALKGAIYLCLIGPEGLRRVGMLNMDRAQRTREALLRIKGVRALFEVPYFNEFVLSIDKPADKLRESFRKHKIIGPLELARFYPQLRSAYLFAATEKRTEEDKERLVKAVSDA